MAMGPCVVVRGGGGDAAEFVVWVKEEEGAVKTADSEVLPVVTIHVPSDSDPRNVELKLVPRRLVEGALSAPLPKRPPVWKRETPKPPGAGGGGVSQPGGRRRVLVDWPTSIPVSEFKAQLKDTSDIVTTLDVAPATRQKVRELNTNSVSKLFAYPGKMQPSGRLRRLYQRHLTSHFTEHEPTSDLPLPPLEAPQPPPPKSLPAVIKHAGNMTIGTGSEVIYVNGDEIVIVRTEDV